MAWGIDGNVREATDAERRSDGFLRMMLDGSAGALRTHGIAAGIGVRALADRYSRYGSESRDQLEGSLELQRRIGARATLWGSGRLEWRSYPDSTRRDYNRGAFAFGVRTPLRGGTLTLGGSGRAIDFRATDRFGRRSRAFSLSYRRAAGRGMEIAGSAEFESSHWGRAAYYYEPQSASIGPRGFDQKDQSRDGALSFRYIRGWLFEAAFGWRSVRSNSIGYSLSRKSAEAGVSGWLPGAVLLQIRGRAETLAYRDRNLDQLYVLRNENIESSEDNNSLALRLRRKISSRLALDGRVSWFRNESPFIGYYYRKAVGTIGLSWAPVGVSDF